MHYMHDYIRLIGVFGIFGIPIKKEKSGELNLER